jgi:hypothetical protein
VSYHNDIVYTTCTVWLWKKYGTTCAPICRALWQEIMSDWQENLERQWTNFCLNIYELRSIVISVERDHSLCKCIRLFCLSTHIQLTITEPDSKVFKKISPTVYRNFLIHHWLQLSTPDNKSVKTQDILKPLKMFYTSLSSHCEFLLVTMPLWLNISFMQVTVRRKICGKEDRQIYHSLAFDLCSTIKGRVTQSTLLTPLQACHWHWRCTGLHLYQWQTWNKPASPIRGPWKWPFTASSLTSVRSQTHHLHLSVHRLITYIWPFTCSSLTSVRPQAHHLHLSVHRLITYTCTSTGSSFTSVRSQAHHLHLYVHRIIIYMWQFTGSSLTPGRSQAHHLHLYVHRLITYTCPFTGTSLTPVRSQAHHLHLYVHRIIIYMWQFTGSSLTSGRSQAQHLHLAVHRLITYIWPFTDSSLTTGRSQAHHLHLSVHRLITYICTSTGSSFTCDSSQAHHLHLSVHRLITYTCQFTGSSLTYVHPQAHHLHLSVHRLITYIWPPAYSPFLELTPIGLY